MSNVYIKTVEGGETTTPTTSHYLELDDGTNSTYISIANLLKFVNSLTADATPDSGADYVLTYDASASAAKKVLISSLGGGGGLTVTAASVTTSNVTGVEGTLHNLDVSGMTANRDFNLPTPSAAGKRVGVRLSTGDATYALLLKANSSEITRVFITGEIMIFVSTGTGAGDWAVEHDGRIPCVARLSSTGTQSISNATSTKVTLSVSDFDNASINDTANYRINIRRTNKYILSGGCRYNNLSANTIRLTLWIRDTSSANALQLVETFAAIGGYPGISIATTKDRTAGDQVDLYTYQNSGSSETLNLATGDSHLELVEVLA